MRPARARWGADHFRTPSGPYVKFPNEQSNMGHFNQQSIDRTLLRDRYLERSWPSETVRIPEYPMELQLPTPADNKFPWLPYERFSEEERRFENFLDGCNQRFCGGAANRQRRRSTMRVTSLDKNDQTDYTALINQEIEAPKEKKKHRFGDPEENKLRDRDSLRRMQSWIKCEKQEDGHTKYGDAWDLRMTRWIEQHQDRIAAEKNAEKRKGEKKHYKRQSHYGKLMEDEASMTSYSTTMSMTSDPTAIPTGNTKSEKRRTMAFIKT